MGYLGSKGGSGVYQALIAMMPPHETYIETHLGGGAVMARKPPALVNIGIDLDPAPLAAFECGYPVTLVQADAHCWLRSRKWAGNELIYADPPYLVETRSSAASRYRCDYERHHHEGLLRLLKAVPCAVMVSGYPNPLYDAFLEGWASFEFQAMTRGGVRTEKVWCNFPLDGPKFCGTFAGRNFTDRQRIKRKAARWRARYRALPNGERLAVLAALLECESTAAIDGHGDGAA